MGTKRVHLWISGIVQGVFFRYSTQRKAMDLGVGGWVRNCPDGRVEAVVEGEEKEVNQMVDWCRSGPPQAVVSAVQTHGEEYQGEYRGFLIKG